VRLFSELLAHGEEAEKEAGADSPFFQGGMESSIHSIVTLAAPMNGTTAYDLFSDPAFDPAGVKVPWWSRGLARMMSLGTKPKRDGRDGRDYANYDMHIDNALAMNRRITTLSSVYYFSVPCSLTYQRKDGAHKPKKGMEPLFVMRACQIGAYIGKTAGGVELDESWRENDGLVNTVSAMAPMGAPSKPLDEGNISPGMWNVFPRADCDHMGLQGGLMRKHDIRGFYLKLLRMIGQL
jgi:triacylglycerol lipase